MKLGASGALEDTAVVPTGALTIGTWRSASAGSRAGA